MDGPSAVPGLKGMDVLTALEEVNVWQDGKGEDERLEDAELHARVRHWLQSGMTQNELKEKVQAEGMRISGNKKVLALRLAWRGLPSNPIPSPVFSSGSAGSSNVGACLAPQRDMSGGGTLDKQFDAAANTHAAAAATPALQAAVQGDAQDDEDDDVLGDDWVPLTASGKQKSCNAIRGEIQRFLTRGTMTQTAFLQAISCNSNSYGRFMKLKGAWNGTQNGVYWGAARFFEIEKRRAARERKNAGPAAAKRQRAEANDAKKKAKREGEDLLARVSTIDVPEGTPVFDTCAEVRRKITAFLKTGMVTQSAFLKHLGVAPNSFGSFMKQNGRADPENIANMQPGAANHVYPKAYRFFEQKRLLEQKPKTDGRKNNEAMLAANKARQAALWGGLGNAELAAKYVTDGFALRHDDGKRWVFGR